MQRDRRNQLSVEIELLKKIFDDVVVQDNGQDIEGYLQNMLHEKANEFANLIG